MTRRKHYTGDNSDVTKRCLVVEDDHFTRVTLTSALQSGEGLGQGAPGRVFPTVSAGSPSNRSAAGLNGIQTTT